MGDRPANRTHGLTARVVLAGSVLAVIVAAVFVILLVAINRQRDAAELSRHSQRVLAAAEGLERLLIDLETGERGFVITGEESFLEPWTAARSAILAASRELNRLAAVPAQSERADRITDVVRSYIREFSLPIVNAARRGDASAGSLERTADGKRRVDALRAQFDELVAAERELAETRATHAPRTRFGWQSSWPRSVLPAGSS